MWTERHLGLVTDVISRPFKGNTVETRTKSSQPVHVKPEKLEKGEGLKPRTWFGILQVPDSRCFELSNGQDVEMQLWSPKTRTRAEL